MSEGRTYGGESAADRTARRRRQLLDAGLEVFGTIGYRAATVRQICGAAKVTDRYFYEQFDGTEALLLAVYGECTDRIESSIVGAVAAADDDVAAAARAGISALLEVVVADPRLARVVWFEVLGVSPRVEQAYLARMAAFGELLVGLWGERVGYGDLTDLQLRIMSNAVVGGISHAVMDWLAAGFEASPEQMGEALARFLAASAGVGVPEGT